MKPGRHEKLAILQQFWLQKDIPCVMFGFVFFSPIFSHLQIVSKGQVENLARVCA